MEKMNQPTPFKPAWWLPGAHLQTIWAALKNANVNIAINRERLYLPDGDFIDLDWTTTQNNGPTVLLIHGLEGSLESGYAKTTLHVLDKHGFQGVFMNLRGCSGEPNLKAKTYHAGETSDLAFVIEHISSKQVDKKISVIGFSLGGNMLLKYLGKTQNSNPIDSAIAISVPFCLKRCSDRLQKGFSRIYQSRLINELCNKIETKNLHLKTPVIFNKKEINNFYKFDHLLTAKLHGFASGEDYYAKSSCKHYLTHITKPTLIIHAKDDPFMYPDAIPDKALLPSNIELELYKRGGHMGFVAGGNPFKPKYWLEERIPSYLNKLL